MKLNNKIMALCSALHLSAFFSANVFAQVPTTLQSDGRDTRTSYILNATLASGTTNCGSNQQISNGWIVDAEAFFNHDGKLAKTFVPSTGGYFSTATGTFIAPVDGFYHVGATVRIETGNGDVSLRHNGSQVAAMGTDLVERQGDRSAFGSIWSSHSLTKNLFLNAGDTLALFHEGGNSSDCILATNYNHNNFNVTLIRAVEGKG